MGQFCRDSGDIAEIRRLELGRHPGGGHLETTNVVRYGSLTWLLESGVLPRLGDSVGEVGYDVSMGEITDVGKNGEMRPTSVMAYRNCAHCGNGCLLLRVIRRCEVPRGALKAARRYD